MNSKTVGFVAVLLATAAAVGVASGDGTPGGVDTSSVAASNYMLDVPDSVLSWHVYQTWRDEWLPAGTGSLGSLFGERIVAPLSVHGLFLDFEDTSFVRAGIDYSQALSAGIDYKSNSRLSFRLGIDADHLETPRDSGDPLLSPLGIDAGNESRSRWAFPVSAAMTYSFD